MGQKQVHASAVHFGVHRLQTGVTTWERVVAWAHVGEEPKTQDDDIVFIGNRKPDKVIRSICGGNYEPVKSLFRVKLSPRT